MSTIISPEYTRFPLIPLSYTNKHMAIPEEIVVDYNASIIYVMNETGDGLIKLNDPTAIFHIEDYNNPHGITKDQIGLGNVINQKQATEEEFITHKDDYENPHKVTKEQVGLGNVINKEQASKEELEAFRVECSDYISQMNGIIQSIEDILNKKHTLTINTDIEDAIVKVYYDDKWNEGKVHRLIDGTYKYEVTRNGFSKVEIIPDPLDAKVEIKVDDVYVEGQTQYLQNGSYEYKITKDGYIPSLGYITVNSTDIVENVKLDQQLYTIFIKPIPSDAIIKYQINGEWVQENPIEVPNGTYLCEAYKEGYPSKTITIDVYDTDTNMNVRL